MQPPFDEKVKSTLQTMNDLVGDWPVTVKEEWVNPDTFHAQWERFVEAVNAWEEIGITCWQSVYQEIDGRPLYQWKIEQESLLLCQRLIESLRPMNSFSEQWYQEYSQTINARLEKARLALESVDPSLTKAFEEFFGVGNEH